MLNLFMLILVQQFEANFSNPDNPLDSFTHHAEEFRDVWSRYSGKYQGWKIHSRDLGYFFMSLRAPLGFKGVSKKDLNWEAENAPLTMIEVTKEIHKMEVAEDEEGFAYYNDVLYVSLRRCFGWKLDG